MGIIKENYLASKMMLFQKRKQLAVHFAREIQTYQHHFHLLTAIGALKFFKVGNLLHTRLTPRSEEHTSELQSRENLVCRLLLEKKKKKGVLLFIDANNHLLSVHPNTSSTSC